MARAPGEYGFGGNRVGSLLRVSSSTMVAAATRGFTVDRPAPLPKAVRVFSSGSIGRDSTLMALGSSVSTAGATVRRGLAARRDELSAAIAARAMVGGRTARWGMRIHNSEAAAASRNVAATSDATNSRICELCG